MGVVAFMDDLMFLSRVREAARAQNLDVKTARSVDGLLMACKPRPRIILMDLDSPRLPTLEALGALKASAELREVPVLGFFSHVDAERAREAEAAGCSRVLPRSAFVRDLAGLLASPAPSGEGS